MCTTPEDPCGVLWWPTTATSRSGARHAIVGHHGAVTRSGSGSGRGISPGPRPPVLRHRGDRAQCVRRALVPCGTGCEGTGHQVLVRRTPHRARCLLLAPACRALRAATPVVGFVIGQQRPPALDEPRQFRTRYGEQGTRVRAVRQLGKRIEPFAHRVAQYLSQYLVHCNRHSLSCLITAYRGAVTQRADSVGRRHRDMAGQPDKHFRVPVSKYGREPARTDARPTRARTAAGLLRPVETVSTRTGPAWRPNAP